MGLGHHVGVQRQVVLHRRMALGELRRIHHLEGLLLQRHS